MCLNKFIRKAACCVAFMCFFAVQGKGQEDCVVALETAWFLYDTGKFEEVPRLLKDCMVSGFSRLQMERANRLLILAYLAANQRAEAETTMHRLLRDNPLYSPHPSDSPELRALFSEFSSKRIIAFSAFAGSNLSLARMIEQYGPYDPGTDHGSYSFRKPGFQTGAGLAVFPVSRVEIHLEGIYTYNSFVYSSLQHGFARVRAEETQQRIEFPASVTFDILLSELAPYIRLGASYGMMMSAVTDYSRTHKNTGELFYSPFRSTGINIDEKRTSQTLSAVAGAGIKLRAGRGDLFIDLRYFHSLTCMAVEDKRWEPQTVFDFFYAESDFRLDNLTISAGYRLPVYRIVNR